MVPDIETKKPKVDLTEQPRMNLSADVRTIPRPGTSLCTFVEILNYPLEMGTIEFIFAIWDLTLIIIKAYMCVLCLLLCQKRSL